MIRSKRSLSPFHHTFTKIFTIHFTKIQEIEDEEESEDEDDENDEDVLIELRSCGITTQWLCPKNCRRCPVKSCCRNFDTRSKFIKHYKKMHALGSICCPGKRHLTTISLIQLMQ